MIRIFIVHINNNILAKCFLVVTSCFLALFDAFAQQDLDNLFNTCQDEESAKNTLIPALEKAASEGNAKAEENLVMVYCTRVNMPEKTQDCLNRLTKLANQGMETACMALAHTYLTGKLSVYFNGSDDYLSSNYQVPINSILATDFLEKAIEKGYLPAYCRYGYMLLLGEAGTRQDIFKGIQCLSDAAEKGSIRACMMLTDLYAGYNDLSGIVQHDTENAFYFCSKAAELGDARSQMRLAYLFYDTNEEDPGLTPDRLLFMYWLRKSADNNYPPAQYTYGCNIVLDGNEEEGFKWLIKSADNYYYDAADLLTRQYGIRGNWNEAKHWCDRMLVIDPNSLDAHLYMADIGSHTKTAKEYFNVLIETKEWLFNSQSTNGEALNYIAVCLFQLEGDLSRADKKIAYEEGLKLLYHSADVLNYPPSQFKLAQVYKAGKYGIKKDEKKAISYLTLAAKNGDKDAQSVCAPLGIQYY